MLKVNELGETINALSEQFTKVINLINYTNKMKYILRRVWSGYRKVKAENRELKAENKLYKEFLDLKRMEVEQLKAQLKQLQ